MGWWVISVCVRKRRSSEAGQAGSVLFQNPFDCCWQVVQQHSYGGFDVSFVIVAVLAGAPSANSGAPSISRQGGVRGVVGEILRGIAEHHGNSGCIIQTGEFDAQIGVYRQIRA